MWWLAKGFDDLDLDSRVSNKTFGCYLIIGVMLILIFANIIPQNAIATIVLGMLSIVAILIGGYVRIFK